MTEKNTPNALQPSVYRIDTLHIGQCIKEELSRQGRTITWLAGEVHCTRENLYKVFQHPWISTDMLFKISRALDHDFFMDCSASLKSGKASSRSGR